MSTITRRAFMELAGRLSIAMGMTASYVPRIAQSLENFADRKERFLWLQGLCCSGCSISLLNSDGPGPAELLTELIAMQFHPALSTATGQMAIDVVNRTIDEGNYILIVEGAMPVGMVEACLVGHTPITSLVSLAAARAKAILAVGTCAAYGGIPGAEGNTTGSVSVPAFLQNQNIEAPIVNLPGCPAHPDWVVGTLVHLLEFGFPALDDERRPKMFFTKLLHEQCPRYSDYEREKFATAFSEDGCMFKLGCQGPITHADCSLRLWNARTNFCINARALCYGCASKNFAAKQSFPFITLPSTTIKTNQES